MPGLKTHSHTHTVTKESGSETVFHSLAFSVAELRNTAIFLSTDNSQLGQRQTCVCAERREEEQRMDTLDGGRHSLPCESNIGLKIVIVIFK